jgi:hypothetical protein
VVKQRYSAIQDWGVLGAQYDDYDDDDANVMNYYWREDDETPPTSPGPFMDNDSGPIYGVLKEMSSSVDLTTIQSLTLIQLLIQRLGTIYW